MPHLNIGNGKKEPKNLHITMINTKKSCWQILSTFYKCSTISSLSLTIYLESFQEVSHYDRKSTV